ncbi:hypothetical protein OHB12_04775 [Nocardia sp. NBC_01730]|uniref:hypothetical protein n=1 Tax=Nocardia sp. NBC_01730 TaxID=2975998 RepID=UPI002E0FAEF3|nr:hypothetical protein OHB12_04775 [Nocardia sp. NBC_01730]
MNKPVPGMEELPSWKLRLLERIQNTSADHVRVLLQGHPTYEPQHGSGEIPMQTWRTHLRALAADQHEIEIHASAVGVPAAAITEARERGERGLRWGDSVHSPPTMRHGQDPVRAHMVEGAAADVWQLEHMAAISVAHRLRSIDARFPPDPQAHQQFDRNMAALWRRANDTGHVIGLTGDEHAELWGRDWQGWKQLVGATVHRYSDAALHERWRAYAWGGIEHEARRGIDNLAAGAALERPGAGPQTLEELIGRATEAVINGHDGTGTQISAAIGDALPHDVIGPWVSQADGEPVLRPPEPGSSAQYEL